MNKRLSEAEIDDLVERSADDEAAWEPPVQVRRARGVSFALSAELAARAAFLARLHREKALADWLQRIIRERVELEEGAFREVKKTLAPEH
jgi:hypothetical protein